MNREILREVDHELTDQRVRDRVTGRVGTLKVVYRYVDAITGRVARDEAHLRPVDGSGYEWTADPKNLVCADDQAGKSGAASALPT